MNFAFDSTKSFQLTQWIRVSFFVVLLMVALSFQFNQRYFFNPSLDVPTLVLLGVLFLNHAILLLNRGSFTKWLYFGVAVLDVFLLSGLYYYSTESLPIFVLLFALNILLSGVFLSQKLTLSLAGLTAMAFNITVALDTTSSIPMISLLFNNLAFFTVAFFSGFVREQFDFMSEEIREKSQSLAAVRHLNELIVDNVPSGLVTANSLGQIIQANDAAEKIFQVPLLAKKISELFEQEDFDFQQPGRRDVTYFRAANEELTLNMSSQSFFDPSVNQTGYVMTFEDMTRERRLEQKIRQSEKLAAVGQLAAGIAHEIRNPLASISGSVEMLQSMGGDESQQRLMKIVVRESHRLSDLISEFLEYVRPDESLKDEVNLSNLAHEIADIIKLNPSLPKSIELKLNIAQNLKVLGDRNKLKQAVLNIVINAYQAMTESEKQVCEIIVHEKEGPTLVVRDSGMGMDEKTRLRIFEPFLTTKVKGTGLGLAVTQKILENHGAEIEVNSKLGEGTEFVLNFPAVPT